MKVLNIVTLIYLDLDECLTDTDICNENANCTNTDGSYACQCVKGYSGDGYSCTGEYQQW